MWIRVVNKKCGPKLGAKLVEKLWILIVNTNFEQKLWTKVINYIEFGAGICEQLFWAKDWTKGLKAVDKSWEQEMGTTALKRIQSKICEQSCKQNNNFTLKNDVDKGSEQK